MVIYIRLRTAAPRLFYRTVSCVSEADELQRSCSETREAERDVKLERLRGDARKAVCRDAGYGVLRQEAD